MATVDPGEILVPSPEAASPASPTSSTGQIPLEHPPKTKGRRKLLQSLQRISSSPTLARRGRSASTGYRRDGKASLSCVSLSQSSYAPCLGNGSSSQLYGGLNARPTTPGSAGLYAHDDENENARIRLVGSDSPSGSHARKIALPTDLRPGSRGSPLANGMLGDVAVVQTTPEPQAFDLWGSMPYEIRMLILSHLSAKDLIRCSAVCKSWNKMCYDGQLWSTIDASEYYSDISPEALAKIIAAGGPFVRDLNLRGCVQLRDRWLNEGEGIMDLCRNVVNFSLQGVRIEKTAIHCFFLRNERLEYVNVSGLSAVTNTAMKIIARSCRRLRILNVSWCRNVHTSGLKHVVKACPELSELLASEILGFDDEKFASEVFKRNALERLVISRTDITDDCLKILMHGIDPEMDLLEDRPIVPPRRLKHLDLQQCSQLTDTGVESLVYNVPDLEGLQLSQCVQLTDDCVASVVRTTPRLTHLELEDMQGLTNRALTELAGSPCARVLEHLNISSCEAIGDLGMLAVLKSCPSLRSVEMDNTRISDLTLTEASYRIRKRGHGVNVPRIGLRIVAFDCANVTWVGVRDVLSSNAYVPRKLKVLKVNPDVVQIITPVTSSGSMPVVTSPITPPPQPTLYPNEIIQLKCFYGWQMTVDEHTKRVLRGDLAAANRLDRKWAEYMMTTEEAGATGGGARRRRRRVREAEQIYNEDDEDEESYSVGGIMLGGRRRRAQSGGSCVVM